MNNSTSYSLDPIGIVQSPLTRLEDSPAQGIESAPKAWLEIFPRFAEALEGIGPGAEIMVLTWLHLAQRDVLKDHPPTQPCKAPYRGVCNSFSRQAQPDWAAPREGSRSRQPSRSKSRLSGGG